MRRDPFVLLGLFTSGQACLGFIRRLPLTPQILAWHELASLPNKKLTVRTYM